jgi:solute carrier family 25 protein 39/40
MVKYCVPTIRCQMRWDSKYLGYGRGPNINCRISPTNCLENRRLRKAQATDRMAAAIPGSQYHGPPQNVGHNITAIQKSISAISGALVTSLLVTPLDVVRVRLQSQQTTPTPGPSSVPSRILTGARLGYSTLGVDAKSGVTACCREVFFQRGWSVNGAAVQCDYIPFESPTIENGFCAAEETGKRSFRGTWEGLVKIARYEGVSSLWRGLSPTL